MRGRKGAKEEGSEGKGEGRDMRPHDEETESVGAGRTLLSTWQVESTPSEFDTTCLDTARLSVEARWTG